MLKKLPRISPATVPYEAICEATVEFVSSPGHGPSSEARLTAGEGQIPQQTVPWYCHGAEQ